MTGSSPPDGTVGISADVVQVLLISGLMKRFSIKLFCTVWVEISPNVVITMFIIMYFSDEQEQSPMITPSGFQFLLMDAASQIWYFMLKYLDTVEVQ